MKNNVPDFLHSRYRNPVFFFRSYTNRITLGSILRKIISVGERALKIKIEILIHRLWRLMKIFLHSFDSSRLIYSSVFFRDSDSRNFVSSKKKSTPNELWAMQIRDSEASKSVTKLAWNKCYLFLEHNIKVDNGNSSSQNPTRTAYEVRVKINTKLGKQYFPVFEKSDREIDRYRKNNYITIIIIYSRKIWLKIKNISFPFKPRGRKMKITTSQEFVRKLRITSGGCGRV